MFVMYKNELYIKHLERILETRSNFAILSLYILRSKYSIPHVLGGISIVDEPPTRGPSNAPLFSFTRLSGSKYPPLLFPDFDFFGYPDVWVPPFDTVVSEFLRTNIPWKDKVNKAFWSGTINSRVRKGALQCAPSFPRSVKIERINTDLYMHNSTLNNIMAVRLKKFESIISISPEERAYKNKHQDLRKLQRYRYNLYLPGTSWSSSLKRIIATGGAVMIPLPNKCGRISYPEFSSAINSSFRSKRSRRTGGTQVKVDYASRWMHTSIRLAAGRIREKKTI